MERPAEKSVLPIREIPALVVRFPQATRFLAGLPVPWAWRGQQQQWISLIPSDIPALVARSRVQAQPPCLPYTVYCLLVSSRQTSVQFAVQGPFVTPHPCFPVAQAAGPYA
jgi:hypothetical protein